MQQDCEPCCLLWLSARSVLAVANRSVRHVRRRTRSTGRVVPLWDRCAPLRLDWWSFPSLQKTLALQRVPEFSGWCKRLWSHQTHASLRRRWPATRTVFRVLLLRQAGKWSCCPESTQTNQRNDRNSESEVLVLPLAARELMPGESGCTLVLFPERS